MEPTRPVSDVSHYLGLFRRHWWVALLATGAGLAGGAVVSNALPKVYESTTSVLVQAVDQDVNAQGAGEIAVSAALIDARDKGHKGDFPGVRFVFQRCPEFGLERDRGAMARNREGAFF